ncbi:MarR family transcriptional regulator [Patescibacteria group bacterium]|nr:MarR family transcriptional regulator [Patescibacteria group bacterium]
MSLLKRLIVKHLTLTTYQIGVLVARTHRVLKSHTDAVLAPYDLTSVDWAIIGLLHDDKRTGMKLSVLSEELGVEAPFITLRIKRLQDRNLVSITAGKTDKRERLATITSAGSELVTTIEPILRKESRKWLRGAGPLDVKGFITVMKTVTLNDQND